VTTLCASQDGPADWGAGQRASRTAADDGRASSPQSLPQASGTALAASLQCRIICFHPFGTKTVFRLSYPGTVAVDMCDF
jgi:hypothetical protein